MARYRRINIDGKSLFKTETRTVTAAILPGTFARIDSATDQFVPVATGDRNRVYVIGAAEHQGLGVRDPVPAGNSAVGNYVEEGRELAILCAPGTYAKDTPVTVGAGAMGAVGTDANCIGYSQDEFTIAAGATDFIRVRMRNGVAAAA